ncbi:hypothetical protein LF1_59240 [Rubripirellula obstinata]|uniref:Uncharacterized protein n=1 Tax=Rubripirellula obstinata TaxID=406547 RepID=A0A5B1C6T8_9BACT|nr:hypothetical protein LF1_59240 [Rubripirellula obstinata]
MHRMAAARFSLCLHVKSRHLGDAYRYPTERGHLLPASRPAGHNLRTTNTALPPNTRSIPKSRLPCGASTQRLNSNA